MSDVFDIVFLGLTVTSSWGNGHATTYRSLIRGLAERRHRILFLERDTPWYAGNRDLPKVPGATVELYDSFDELIERFEAQVRTARFVVVGSYVPDGVRIGEWVTSIAPGRTAFYDIDTPVTLANLRAGIDEYISARLVSRFDAYFSFTAGPVLRILERDYGSPMARPLYCSVDERLYSPVETAQRWDLGYLGTYSEDRQPALDRMLLQPARRWAEGRFAVAGPLYPDSIEWPSNTFYTIHLSPSQHSCFYSSQRATLNITRQAMKVAGYSPSVRLFEAAACGTPIISDWWEGLDQILEPSTEVLIAEDTEDVLRFLRDVPAERLRGIGTAGRQRILREHTAAQRALQFERYAREIHEHARAGAVVS